MFLNPLRQKIADGKPVIGPILQEIPDSPDLVEFLGSAGFDYVMVRHIVGDHALMLRSFERIGRDVMPRIRDL